MRTRPKLRTRLLLLVAVLSVTAVAGEWLYRQLRRAPEMFFEDAQRHSFHTRSHYSEAERLQMVSFFAQFMQPVTAPMPRPLVTEWVPGSTFYICYTGPQQKYFDAQGCVEYRINALGLRDRPDLTVAKPPGRVRVLCLGDSFTLGWGVRQEHVWPVLAEHELQQHWPAVQVVNCGGAGTSYADEYWYGLQHRFGRLQPDAVLVALCLNDLIITNGKLCQLREEPFWSGSALLADLRHALDPGGELRLPQDRDWVQELIDLPAGHPFYLGKRFLDGTPESPAIYWKGGAPQQALRGIRDWCKEHGAKVGVAIWPFLQGLGEGESYPFAKLHQMVGEFCRQEGIPFCDLLPALRGHDDAELWVSPVDMHPNELAQQLVTATVAAFMADVLGLR